MEAHMVDLRENKRWFWLAMRLRVAAVTFAIGIAANWAWTRMVFRPSPPMQQQPVAIAIDYTGADIGTLKRSILEAKANGENTVELFVLACGWDIGNLRDALSRDTIVLAELVGKKTYADTWGLHTWYRFRIKETLVDHPYPPSAYSPFRSAPVELLPIAEDEFLIQEANGRMEIDGITVKQGSNGAQYREGQTYLLFLWIDASRRTAIRSGTDPLGVFLVDGDGNFRSYSDAEYPLKEQLAKRFNNSVENLRQALKK